MVTSSPLSVQIPNFQPVDLVRRQIESRVNDLIGSLPAPEQLSAEQRRGVIARYAAVLEGNFIYWMTATLLSVKSPEARSIIEENLLEEVRDCHPGMMHRFAVAAQAAPTEVDFSAVHQDLTKVRLFLGRLSAVKSIITMAFFEGFIQRFMGYLADVAKHQGSLDMEYTDVHGVCDVTHTQELFRALAAEMSLDDSTDNEDLFEGVEMLRKLIQAMIHRDYPKTLAAHSAIVV